MITTGIIKEINISESDSDIKNNKYKVLLPIFNTPDNTNEDGCIMDCTASVIGGIYSPYQVGDMVYVSFVNSEFQSPVIIGKIYKGNTEEIRSYAKLDSLYVDSTTTLPKNTTIGDISYIQLDKAIKKIQDMSGGSGGTPGAIADVRVDGISVVDALGIANINLTSYQPKLVSGTNIKTINNQSILGSGNIDIQGGGSGWDYTIGYENKIIVNELGDEVLKSSGEYGTYLGDTTNMGIDTHIVGNNIDFTYIDNNSDEQTIYASDIKDTVDNHLKSVSVNQEVLTIVDQNDNSIDFTGVLKVDGNNDSLYFNNFSNTFVIINKRGRILGKNLYYGSLTLDRVTSLITSDYILTGTFVDNQNKIYKYSKTFSSSTNYVNYADIIDDMTEVGYITNASVSGNTLTLTKQDGNTVSFTGETDAYTPTSGTKTINGDLKVVGHNSSSNLDYRIYVGAGNGYLSSYGSAALGIFNSAQGIGLDASGTYSSIELKSNGYSGSDYGSIRFLAAGQILAKTYNGNTYTPTSDDSVVTKKYVDDNKLAKPTNTPEVGYVVALDQHYNPVYRKVADISATSYVVTTDPGDIIDGGVSIPTTGAVAGYSYLTKNDYISITYNLPYRLNISVGSGAGSNYVDVRIRHYGSGHYSFINFGLISITHSNPGDVIYGPTIFDPILNKKVRIVVSFTTDVYSYVNFAFTDEDGTVITLTSSDSVQIRPIK